MCGIVGALSFQNQSFRITDSYIRRMRETMIHRGPDGAGSWISADGRVGLGHRRLAIIDLSEAAAQPMCNSSKTLWVTFNGEIYNHAEIRRELEQRGITDWKTDHSDTEVVLRAFEVWGIECVNKFRGMFAFGIWDTRSRELWLARDRIGIKPLYYSLHHGRITFASEIKALLEDPQQQRSVDEEALYHYLTFAVTPAPMTLFSGIRKLPAATWMKISDSGEVRQQRYWDVLDHTQPMEHMTESEIAEQLIDTLRSAVKYRTVSDVPIGVFLSGGIDSSTNAALFTEESNSPLRTFTLEYDGEYDSNPSEAPCARQVARQFHAEHHEVRVSESDLLSFLPRMIELQDEPIADPVCIPVHYVSNLARKSGIIVAQVGEGADELHCGYPGWQRLLKLERWSRLPFSGTGMRLAMAGLRAAGRRGSWPWERLRRSSLGQPVCWSGGGEAFSEWSKQQLLSPRLKKRFKDLDTWSILQPIHESFRERAAEPSTLNWMSYLDLNLRLPELLLMRVDKMSMGVSLEARVPFLDHKFVELSMSIPSHLKHANGNLKHILKRAVRGLIPDEIIDRPKQGFGVPINEWLYSGLGARLREELDDFCQATNLLDATAVRQVVDRGDPSSWYLFNLALWWKHSIAKEDIGDASEFRTHTRPAA